jgi:hypothetical protein
MVLAVTMDLEHQLTPHGPSMRHAFVAVLVAAFPSPIHGQSATSERASFVTVLGRDTVVIESFARTASHIEGDIVIRVPATVRQRYTVDRAADGRFVKSVVETIPLGTDDILARKVTLLVDRDSLRITVDSAGQQRRETRSIAPNVVPLFVTGFNESFGLYEALGLHEFFLAQPLVTSTTPRDTLEVKSLAIATGRSSPRRLVRRSSREVDFDFFKIAWTHLTLDDSARILSADARETTEKTESRRTAYVDAGRAAKSFASRDRSGNGIGSASPNQVVTASLGSTRVRIAYGSPRRRGRDVLGQVVPYGQVWRTGANSATEIAVDHDVRIGDATVPAGAYSLWTIPRQDGVTLIINRQAGQWGTEYHQQQDLARVPMRTATAPEPRENFVISIDGPDRARELRIAWDTFVWSVPIAVK